jgi:hypothetical protein
MALYGCLQGLLRRAEDFTLARLRLAGRKPGDRYRFCYPLERSSARDRIARQSSVMGHENVGTGTRVCMVGKLD